MYIHLQYIFVSRILPFPLKLDKKGYEKYFCGVGSFVQLLWQVQLKPS